MSILFTSRPQGAPGIPRRWVMAGVMLAACTGPARAQTGAPYALTPASAEYARAVQSARTYIDSLMVAAGIPGLSVAVGVEDEIVWSEGFGLADVENRVPVSSLTKFRIGSVSKTLTAAALAILVEEGRLDLDAPIQAYVPSFPEKEYPVTTRQLAGHLGGIRHYRPNESVDDGQRPYRDVVDALAIFRDDPLLHPPGSRYEYSSFGWNLISAVIQGAAGQPFLRFMDDRVFEHLGMRHTVADHVDSIIPFRTRFYARNDRGRLVNAPWVNNSYKWAGGGFLSTMEDLVRFAFAHNHAGFLEKRTVELLWRSQHTTAGEATGYGMGWRTRTTDAGERIVGHGGSSVGGRTWLLMYPDEAVVVAMTANLSNAPIREPQARRVAAGFLPPR